MDRDTREFLFGLMAEQRRLAGEAAGLLAGYVLLATAPYVLLDIYAPDRSVFYAWAGFFDWGLGYLLFLVVMYRGGLTTGGTRTGIGTYFVLGIAIGIPVLLALVVLVLPGIYLLMRWLPAYSRALMTHEGVSRAMSWSWERTEPWQRPLAMGMLLPLLPFAVTALTIIVDSFAYEYIGWNGYILLSIIGNGSSSLGYAGLTVYGVAAYKLIRTQGADPGSGQGAPPAPDHPLGTITPQA